jgi:hypothetical protein
VHVARNARSPVSAPNGLAFTCGPDKPGKGFRWEDRRLPGRHAKRAREEAGETRPFKLEARQVQR